MSTSFGTIVTLITTSLAAYVSGQILLGAAAGVARALEAGLQKKILNLFGAKPTSPSAGSDDSADSDEARELAAAIKALDEYKEEIEAEVEQNRARLEKLLEMGRLLQKDEPHTAQGEELKIDPPAPVKSGP